MIVVTFITAPIGQDSKRNLVAAICTSMPRQAFVIGHQWCEGCVRNVQNPMNWTNMKIQGPIKKSKITVPSKKDPSSFHKVRPSFKHLLKNPEELLDSLQVLPNPGPVWEYRPDSLIKLQLCCLILVTSYFNSNSFSLSCSLSSSLRLMKSPPLDLLDHCLDQDLTSLN